MRLYPLSLKSDTTEEEKLRKKNLFRSFQAPHVIHVHSDKVFFLAPFFLFLFKNLLQIFISGCSHKSPFILYYIIVLRSTKKKELPCSLFHFQPILRNGLLVFLSSHSFRHFCHSLLCCFYFLFYSSCVFFLKKNSVILFIQNFLYSNFWNFTRNF